MGSTAKKSLGLVQKPPHIWPTRVFLQLAHVCASLLIPVPLFLNYRQKWISVLEHPYMGDEVPGTDNKGYLLCMKYGTLRFITKCKGQKVKYIRPEPTILVLTKQFHLMWRQLWHSPICYDKSQNMNEACFVCVRSGSFHEQKFVLRISFE